MIDIGTQGFFFLISCSAAVYLLPFLRSSACLPVCLSVSSIYLIIRYPVQQFVFLFCYTMLCYTMQISQLFFFFKAWLYSTACHINT